MRSYQSSQKHLVAYQLSFARMTVSNVGMPPKRKSWLNSCSRRLAGNSRPSPGRMETANSWTDKLRTNFLITFSRKRKPMPHYRYLLFKTMILKHWSALPIIMPRTQVCPCLFSKPISFAGFCAACQNTKTRPWPQLNRNRRLYTAF
jgi:hypothetical protein